MNNISFTKIGENIYEPEKGVLLFRAVKALKRQINCNDFVYIRFNDLDIPMRGSSNSVDIVDKFDLMHTIRRMKAGYDD